MPRIAQPAQPFHTGIPWLDALLASPEAAIPGPAAMTSPIRFVPMGGESGVPTWVSQAIRNVLGRAQKAMPGQPEIGRIGPTVNPAGLVGAAAEASPQLLTVADRIRQFSTPRPAPMHLQSGGGQTLPSEQLMNLMELLRQAAGLSARQ